MFVEGVVCCVLCLSMVDVLLKFDYYFDCEKCRCFDVVYFVSIRLIEP